MCVVEFEYLPPMKHTSVERRRGDEGGALMRDYTIFDCTDQILFKAHKLTSAIFTSISDIHLIDTD